MKILEAFKKATSVNSWSGMIRFAKCRTRQFNSQPTDKDTVKSNLIVGSVLVYPFLAGLLSVASLTDSEGITYNTFHDLKCSELSD